MRITGASRAFTTEAQFCNANFAPCSLWKTCVSFEVSSLEGKVTFLVSFVLYAPPIRFAERNLIQIVPIDLLSSEISSLSCVE